MLFIIYSVAFAPIELLNKRYYFSFGVNCLFIRLQRSLFTLCCSTSALTLCVSRSEEHEKSPCLLIDIGTNNYRGSTLLPMCSSAASFVVLQSAFQSSVFLAPTLPDSLNRGFFYFFFLRTYLTLYHNTVSEGSCQIFRKTCLFMFIFLPSFVAEFLTYFPTFSFDQ